MSTTSASPADRAAPGVEAPARRILVWDAPVRIFHWLMVGCFAGAWLTAESETWRLVHVTLGWTMAGLVAFRLVWGLVGTKHARFSSFVRGPAAVIAYLKSMRSPSPQHTVGHNPAGAVAIVGLLALAVAVTATGWVAYAGTGPGEAFEELHEGVATAMLVLVGLHVAGVALGSWKNRENLVRSMIDGRKQGPASEGLRSARWGLAAVIVAAVLGFWYWQAATAPAPVDQAGAATGGEHAGRDGDRDDD